MFFIGLTSTMKTAFSPERKPHVDERLILELAGGERRALAELYRQTDSAVYGFALSILKDPHAAEDVMHDTYLKILDSAQSYAPMGKPMAWILTIVKNLALMRLRSAKNETELTADQAAGAENSGDFTAEISDRLLLSKVMRLLTDEERQIITLYAVSGLKHREISSVTGLPLSTVLSKYRRSLLKIKKHLEEEHNEK